MDLTEEQWNIVKEYIPEDPKRPDGRGRPWNGTTARIQRNSMGITHRSPMERSSRTVWFLSHSASTLPALGEIGCDEEDPLRLGRRFTKARETQFGRDVFGRQLFSGQKGGSRVGKTKRGKGTKIMAIADANGLPIALYTEAASPAEVTLVGATLESMHVNGKPLHVVADKAYDSDKLRECMADDDMILLAPHRSGRKRPAYNDGRKMRRYKKRWKVERMFAWLHNFRRLVVRYEYHADNFHAFLQLGAAIILLRHL